MLTSLNDSKKDRLYWDAHKTTEEIYLSPNKTCLSCRLKGPIKINNGLEWMLACVLCQRVLNVKKCKTCAHSFAGEPRWSNQTNGELAKFCRKCENGSKFATLEEWEVKKELSYKAWVKRQAKAREAKLAEDEAAAHKLLQEASFEH